MSRSNVPLVAFNRGILSKKALARVDLDRTALSAEVMTNWLPRTQGAMDFRPGTKYVGNSLNDTGAEWIEFVASTDDVALVECSTNKARMWLGSSSHSLSLLSRPAVDTTLTISDTGWVDASTGGDTGKASINAGTLTLNAKAEGAIAKATKRVMVDTGDQNVEHSLAITVSRGPVTFRVGNDTGEDDLVSEASLGTGYHNLAFTPTETEFHITVQSGSLVNRTITSLGIGDTGTVELTTPWGANSLSNLRYDQSADVVYVDCQDIRPQKIERRGTGRSWSVVDYAPNNGPFESFASSIARLSPAALYGNTTISSDIPFFKSGHVGGLINIQHNGQTSVTPLGAQGAVTDAIEVTGFTDTGTAGANRERRVVVEVTGTYSVRNRHG